MNDLSAVLACGSLNFLMLVLKQKQRSTIKIFHSNIEVEAMQRGLSGRCALNESCMEIIRQNSTLRRNST